MALNRFNMDMCSGPLFGKIVRYAIPLAATYILQLMFNAADLIIIGHFSSHESMAAIGTTTEVTALLINIFTGMSIGANVVAAQLYGARDSRGVNRTTHTAIALALLGGVLLMVLGLFAARPLLQLINVPREILPRSCTYIWICFLGIPFLLLYNFGCAILRAVGDTVRPLLFLVAAGVINVLLNLFLVVVCRWDVAGVALATVASQAVSAWLVIRALISARGSCRLIPRLLRIDFPILRRILWIGIPAGIQSACFSISNITIQAAINSFGSLAIAGMTASIGLEWILFAGTYALNQTVVSFVGQNYGRGCYDRVIRSIWICFLCSLVTNVVLGWGMFFNGEMLLGIFNPDPGVISWGMIRIKMAFTVYFLLGFMEITSGGLRGLGYSVLPALNTLLGACVFRVWWVFAVFRHDRTMDTLILSYPISWALVAAVNGLLLFFFCRRLLGGGGRGKYGVLYR